MAPACERRDPEVVHVAKSAEPPGTKPAGTKPPGTNGAKPPGAKPPRQPERPSGGPELPETGAGLGAASGFGGGALLAGLIFLGLGRAKEKRSRLKPRPSRLGPRSSSPPVSTQGGAARDRRRHRFDRD